MTDVTRASGDARAPSPDTSTRPTLRGPPPQSRARIQPPLPRSFYDRPSVELAPALLGQVLVRETAEGLSGGVIVETEAYAGPTDRASHARAGRTARTAPMFGPPAHAYVYFIYGMHDCLNLVAGGEDEAGAVLLRALEPVIGLPLIRERRGRPGSEPDRLLCAGPARLCQGLGVDRRLDGHDLTLGRSLWLAEPDRATTERIASMGVVTGPRVGVAYAGPDWAARPWRFGVRGHASLSRPFPGGA